MADEPSIVLIPKMPGDIPVDPIFKTERGIAVRASDAQIQTLKSRGVPVVTLYSSGNEHAGAMFNLTQDQAKAAINTLQDTRLAMLSQDERSKFGLA
jgi:hypothetical protein